MGPNEMTLLMAVWCPPDRGDDGYEGSVFGWSDTIFRNSVGEQYRWVDVRNRKTGVMSVWPSNRLEEM